MVWTRRSKTVTSSAIFLFWYLLCIENTIERLTCGGGPRKWSLPYHFWDVFPWIDCVEPSLLPEKMKLSSFFSHMSHDLRQHATNFAASKGKPWEFFRATFWTEVWLSHVEDDTLMQQNLSISNQGITWGSPVWYGKRNQRFRRMKE